MKSFIYIFKLVVIGLFRTNGSAAGEVENPLKRTIPLTLFLLLFCSSAYGQDPMPCEIGVWPVCEAELLTTNINFAEGPLWHPDGFLLCSDVGFNQILKIDPQTGAKEVYLSPSGGAIGLAFDAQHNLIMCRGGERGLARLESDGSVTVIASHYGGKRFNSPNDLVVRSDGTIFFTDPTFSNSPAPKELDFNGIFALKPDGKIKLLETSVSNPNGITLSPDEKKLYVSDHPNLTVYVFDITNGLTLINKNVFYQLPSGGAMEGMKVDENGRLFAAVSGSIQIVSPDGNFFDRINVPSGSGFIINLNWGNADYQTLYITTTTSVLKILLNTKGSVTEVEHNDVPRPNHFELMPNYPNPFNPTTIINYTVPSAGRVELKIYNQLGQEIRTLVNTQQSIGTHQVAWDGRDGNGNSVTSGLYFYRLQVGSVVKTRKMVLLR